LRRGPPIDGLEQLDELDLTVALAEDPDDPTRAGVKRSKQVECTLADVLVLDHNRPVARPRRTIS
jgi:hypothetical protein